MQRVDGGAVAVRAPKHGSERDVYLADGLVSLLADHLAVHGTHGPRNWLFVGEASNPPHQNTVGYWWRSRAGATAECDRRIADPFPEQWEAAH